MVGCGVLVGEGAPLVRTMLLIFGRGGGVLSLGAIGADEL